MGLYIERGTIIEALGIRATVKRVLSSDVNERWADIEFFDENDNYRHYKSDYDKGRIIFKSGVVVDYTEVK